MYLGEYVTHPLHSNAGYACATYRAGGHTDWRLPYMHELESIREYLSNTPDSFPFTELPFEIPYGSYHEAGAGCDSGPPANSDATIDPLLFPNLPSLKFWSAEALGAWPSTSSLAFNWYGVDFDTGELFMSVGNFWVSFGVIRCVRNSTPE